MHRELETCQDRKTRLSAIMTPAKDLVTINEGCDLLMANEVLQKSKKGKLPIITRSGLLVAMVSRTDIKKNVEFPNATKAPNFKCFRFPVKLSLRVCSESAACAACRLISTRASWLRRLLAHGLTTRTVFGPLQLLVAWLG